MLGNDGAGFADWDQDATAVAERSDGSAFTVDSLARYFIHGALHHVWDVRPR